LNLSEKCSSRKENIRLRPSGAEGKYIQYLLRATGQRFTNLAQETGVTPQFIPLVVFGQRRSKRIESKIAEILGKESWNDVVLEARSEVQKKPVEVIAREMEQKREAARKAVAERMAEYVTQNMERAERVVSGKKTVKTRRRA